MSLTKRILSKSILSKENKIRAIQSYHEKCIDLLKYRSPSVNSNCEMSKPFHIRLINVIYQVSADLNHFGLDYDDSMISLVHGLQMKRTQDAIRER